MAKFQYKNKTLSKHVSATSSLGCDLPINPGMSQNLELNYNNVKWFIFIYKIKWIHFQY